MFGESFAEKLLGGVNVAMAFQERAYLGLIAATFHRTPAARVVAAGVDEEVAAAAVILAYADPLAGAYPRLQANAVAASLAEPAGLDGLVDTSFLDAARTARADGGAGAGA